MCTEGAATSPCADSRSLPSPALGERRCARAGCGAVRDSRLVAWYRSLTHLAREGRMTVTIGRRELLAAVGGAAAAWPLAARAQHSSRAAIAYVIVINVTTMVCPITSIATPMRRSLDAPRYQGALVRQYACANLRGDER